METIICEQLRRVAIELMEEVTDTEVKMTLKKEIDFNPYKNKNLPVGVTVSFDLGWNKYSSSNKYDSIPGHALIIIWLFNNIFLGVVFSNMYIVCLRAQWNGEESCDHVCNKILRALPNQLKQTQLSSSTKGCILYQRRC